LFSYSYSLQKEKRRANLRVVARALGKARLRVDAPGVLPYSTSAHFILGISIQPPPSELLTKKTAPLRRRFSRALCPGCLSLQAAGDHPFGSCSMTAETSCLLPLQEASQERQFKVLLLNALNSENINLGQRYKIIVEQVSVLA
jgi:hypothetical protein